MLITASPSPPSPPSLRRTNLLSRTLFIVFIVFFVWYYFVLNSLDPSTFITTVNRTGQASVFRGQEVVLLNVQLPMEKIRCNAVIATYVDGEPCIAIAAGSKGAGVYLRHAVTLGEVRSLPYKKDVWCVCVNSTGTKLFFGTSSG